MTDAGDRQQRLKRLREEAAGAPAAQDANAEAGGSTSGAPQANDAEQDVAIPEVKFRNYKPRDDKFAESKVPAAKARALDTVTVAQDDPAAKQTAIDAYAPKKPHLDLKRDAARSLRKLDRETQRAIDELRVEIELQQGDAIQNPQDGVAAAGA